MGGAGGIAGASLLSRVLNVLWLACPQSEHFAVKGPSNKSIIDKEAGKKVRKGATSVRFTHRLRTDTAEQRTSFKKKDQEMGTSKR